MLPYENNDLLAGFITKHLFQFKFMITVILTTLLKTLSVVFVKQARILPKDVRGTYPSAQQPLLYPTGIENL